MQFYYMYVLKRKNGEWYIGSTRNLERRMEEHRQVYKCELVYYEAFRQKDEAQERERKLKHYGSAWRALKTRVA